MGRSIDVTFGMMVPSDVSNATVWRTGMKFGRMMHIAKSGTLRYRYARMGCATKTAAKLWKNWIDLVWWSRKAGKFTGDEHYNSSWQVDNEPVDCGRDLGVLLYSSLSIHQHIARVTSTCFYHLRRLRKLSRILDIKTQKRLVCAVVLTRVDYCNSVLAGLSHSILAPLQRVLHAAARFVLDLRPRDHVTVVLQSLHWLPVHQRITYKLCVLMHGLASGYAPTYLRDAVMPIATLPGRAHLRSADSGQYDVQRVSSLAGSRAFSVAGPQAWNQLPACLRHTNFVATFKRHLKAMYYLRQCML